MFLKGTFLQKVQKVLPRACLFHGNMNNINLTFGSVVCSQPIGTYIYGVFPKRSFFTT